MRRRRVSPAPSESSGVRGLASKTALGGEARAGVAFAFRSEVHLTFSRQGKCPPGIGHLVIVGVKEITEDAVTQDEGQVNRKDTLWSCRTYGRVE